MQRWAHKKQKWEALTEAEVVKKRWKNTQNDYIRKVSVTQITTVVWSLT